MHTSRALVDLDSLPARFPQSVVTVSDLNKLGLTSRSIYNRCRPGGPWQRLQPGVILLSNASPSRAQCMRAALQLAGTGAVITGQDALRLHGLTVGRLTGAVHILVPHRRQVRNTEGMTVERTINLPRPLIRSGFPIAPVARATIDTCRRMTSTDEGRALIAEVVQRGLAEPNALRYELEHGSNRGSALPRRILAEIDDGVRSVAEAWAHRLITRSDLPVPQWNVPLRDGKGKHLAIVDAWWNELGLAWEIDSYQFHLSPASYAATLRRHALLTAAGIVVVHTLPARLRDEPAAVIEELRGAHRLAASRPRPPVVMARPSP